MENKLKSTSIRVKLQKYSSESKFNHIQHHSLNKSPTKNVPSFKTGSLRLLEPTSQKYLIYICRQTPNKFYDIPQYKSKKSTSFGFGTKTNFAKKDYIQPTRYRISSSFDLKGLKKHSASSFGISRQEFYKGKLDKSTSHIGPGFYKLQQLKKKKSFYMGIKMSRKNDSIGPGPAGYNVTPNHTFDQDNSTNNTTILKIKAPRLKTQYFQKPLLQRYNNKVPGPGAYQVSSSSNSIVLLKKLKNKKPTLPQCPRFKVRQQKIPAPGNYQPFSEFGQFN